jgi:hypothetical protein
MQYLKKYEDYKDIRIGDYVLYMSFNPVAATTYSKPKCAKILDVSLSSYFPYKIMVDDGTIDLIRKNCIIRYLTTDEINEYEVKIQSNKYNL